jgi:hypothetical protein
MDMPPTPHLETIDSVMLTPLVRQSIQRGAAEVVDWKIERLYGGSFNSEIHRFSGTARDRDEILPWSLILKIIRSPDGHDDPASLRYWKREALAYQSGLLDQLPDILSAPRCFGVVEQSGMETWLWLEEVMDELSGRWSLDQYGQVARHLGQFNAAGFGKRSQLTQPWLTKGQLRSWVGNNAPEYSPNILAHPLVARAWPNDIYEWMLRVWSEHEAWIDRIEHQPQTLAHLDAFRRNIFSQWNKRSSLQTVMIDWAFVGSAALGEEIAPLVAASLNFLDFDIAQAKALDQVVFEGYLEGLREAGWRGEPSAVRSTYAAASILRYCIGVSGVAHMVADESQRGLLEQIFGHPLEELVDVWGKTNRFLFQLTDEVSRRSAR